GEFARENIKNLILADWFQSLSIELIKLADEIERHGDIYIDRNGTFTVKAVKKLIDFILNGYADFKNNLNIRHLIATQPDYAASTVIPVWKNRNAERALAFIRYHGYFLKEEVANTRLRKKIKYGPDSRRHGGYANGIGVGVTPADFQVNGELSSPDPGYAQKMPPVTSEEHALLKARGEELLKAGVVASGFSAGGMSKRSGGIMRAVFTFSLQKVDKYPRSFLAWKIGIIRSSMEKYGAKIPIIIQTSFMSHDIIKNILKENEYFGLEETDIILVNQGVTKYIIPSESWLDEYLQEEKSERGDEKTRSLAKGIEYEKLFAGDSLAFGDGTNAIYPPGHFGFIRSAVIDGVLAQLKRSGIKYILHANMNNLPGSIIDPAIIAKFDKACEDAKKNNNPLPVMLVEIGENRGEKGGLPAVVKEPGQEPYIRLIEKAAWPSNIPMEGFKHFNTASYVFSVDGLLDLYGLPKTYDMGFRRTRDFVENIDRAVPVPHILGEEIVFSPVRGVEYVVFKSEQCLGDLTAVAGKDGRVVWLEIDRDKRFIPTKTVEDIDIYRPIIEDILKGNVLLPEPVLAGNDTKSSSAESVVYLDASSLIEFGPDTTAIRNAVSKKKGTLLTGSLEGWQKAEAFDFARAHEMIELLKGISVALPEELGDINLYDVLKNAAILNLAVSGNDYSNGIRAGVSIRDNSIFIAVDEINSLSDKELLSVLINSAVKLAAIKRAK
ncbi:MAG: UTP--glucose-1-phosphate uridylyltransferase, partial [Candidatus Omnitrophota bacterium]